MNEFTKRGEAFESKFAHDEAMRFKAVVRRNRLIGRWVAQRLGKSGADAEAYANTVVMADLEEPGDEDLIRKLVSDLRNASVPLDERQIRPMLEDLMVRAVDEIKREL